MSRERSSVSQVLLIDGEHYPPVIARAIERLKSRGVNPVVALMVGGSEKAGQVRLELGFDVVDATADTERVLARELDRVGATEVIDLSDEPVLDYEKRCRLASISLWKGARYSGPDFSFEPPPRKHLGTAPAIGVIGTGKRTGKTAVAGSIARVLSREGLNPVVVAMGRGGPEQPQVMRPDEELTPQSLLAMVERGAHAASDYIEDALTARVPTVGAWRAGGGLAGRPYATNFEEAVSVANRLDPGILIFEGSGAAAPPVEWDAGVLVVDCRIDPSYLCGYFGLYRLLLADFVVLTMYEESTDPGRLAAIEHCIRSRPINPPRVVRTSFRPHPLGEVSGKKVWVATTAPKESGTLIQEHLEHEHRAEVVGMSHSLSDRSRLERDLEGSAAAEVLVVELKAAAVDVVTRFGLESGKQVVYLDNRPVMSREEGSFEDVALEIAAKAKDSFKA